MASIFNSALERGMALICRFIARVRTWSIQNHTIRMISPQSPDDDEQK